MEWFVVVRLRHSKFLRVIYEKCNCVISTWLYCVIFSFIENYIIRYLLNKCSSRINNVPHIGLHTQDHLQQIFFYSQTSFREKIISAFSHVECFCELSEKKKINSSYFFCVQYNLLKALINYSLGSKMYNSSHSSKS